MRTPRYSTTGKVKICYQRDCIGGEYVHGEWVDNDELKNRYTIGNIQPNLNWNQTRLLPEGDRSKRAIVIYCNDELLMAEQGLEKPREADVVIWQGKRWKIMYSMFYQMGILDHCEAIGIMEDQV